MYRNWDFERIPIFHVDAPIVLLESALTAPELMLTNLLSSWFQSLPLIITRFWRESLSADMEAKVTSDVASDIWTAESAEDRGCRRF
jgi:hypothetical protein